jgi:hypothetical protein
VVGFRKAKRHSGDSFRDCEREFTGEFTLFGSFSLPLPSLFLFLLLYFKSSPFLSRSFSFFDIFSPFLENQEASNLPISRQPSDIPLAVRSADYTLWGRFLQMFKGHTKGKPKESKSKNGDTIDERIRSPDLPVQRGEKSDVPFSEVTKSRIFDRKQKKRSKREEVTTSVATSFGDEVKRRHASNTYCTDAGSSMWDSDSESSQSIKAVTRGQEYVFEFSSIGEPKEKNNPSSRSKKRYSHSHPLSQARSSSLSLFLTLCQLSSLASSRKIPSLLQGRKHSAKKTSNRESSGSSQSTVDSVTKGWRSFFDQKSSESASNKSPRPSASHDDPYVGLKASQTPLVGAFDPNIPRFYSKEKPSHRSSLSDVMFILRQLKIFEESEKKFVGFLNVLHQV